MTYRVVHVASGREWRGGQNQVQLLAKALSRHDQLEQLVITGRDTELARRLHAASIPVRTTGWRSSLDPRVLIAAIREARSTTRGARPVILHAHDAHALTLAGLAARLTGAKLLVTRRVDFHIRRPGFWVRADRVVAISDAVRRVLLDDGIRPERIAVVHSGIDPAEVRSAPPFGARQRLNLPPDSTIACNVAALVGHKDQATLVAAAGVLRQRLPRLHWIVAGEGPLRSRLEQQIRELGMTSRVHLLGNVDNPWGLIRESDVFVMSSREEGLGTSVLDALALRIPVAATSGGGIPEILGDGAGLLVPVENPAALATAVESLVTDPNRRIALQEEGDRTLARFSADAMAERMLAVYRSLIPTG